MARIPDPLSASEPIPSKTPNPPDRLHAQAESEVLRALRALSYGSVEVTVHDSRIVQIERRERIRFEPPRPVR